MVNREDFFKNAHIEAELLDEFEWFRRSHGEKKTNGLLIEQFKRIFGIETDVIVARILDVDSNRINNWKNGHSAMPLGVKLRLMDHIGYSSIRNLIFAFMSEDAHKKAIEADNKRMQERGIKKRE
jgi:plasmid maintenance system antidote protein VapI